MVGRKAWYEENYQVSTSTGNLAWAMLALLEHRAESRDSASLSLCVRIGEWMLSTAAESVAGRRPGFRAGVKASPAGWMQDETKSTEHNLALWVAFARLYEATGDERWWRAAVTAREFVQSMWDGSEGLFKYGTRVTSDGRVLASPIRRRR
ncbi:MAG: hypothetical protein ACUVTZ_11500 [Armatimonadota bacterium]